MSTQAAGVICFSADWTYNGGDVTIVIPDGWMILEVISNIQTAFDGTGTVVIGYTTDTDAFLTDAGQGSGAAGYYRASEGSAAQANGYKLATSQDVEIDVTAGTSTAGAGEVYVLACDVVP